MPIISTKKLPKETKSDKTPYYSFLRKPHAKIIRFLLLAKLFAYYLHNYSRLALHKI